MNRMFGRSSCGRCCRGSMLSAAAARPPPRKSRREITGAMFRCRPDGQAHSCSQYFSGRWPDESQISWTEASALPACRLRAAARRPECKSASRGGQSLQRFRLDLPSVDDDGLAGDIGRLLGSEEGGRVADILDRTQALQRNRSRHGLKILLPQALQPFRHDVAGHNRIHRNAVFRQLDAGGAHETELPRLGCTVMGPAGIAGDRAGDRGSDNDAPLAALLEVRYASLDRQEGALEVCIDYVVPALWAHLFDPGLREDAGVGTQNVEPTMPIDGCLRHRLHVGKFGDIRRKRADGGATLAQFLRRGLRILQMAADDQRLRVVAGEYPCDALADALAAASDND